jgi:hypothetical protein
MNYKFHISKSKLATTTTQTHLAEASAKIFLVTFVRHLILFYWNNIYRYVSICNWSAPFQYNWRAQRHIHTRSNLLTHYIHNTHHIE